MSNAEAYSVPLTPRIRKRPATEPGPAYNIMEIFFDTDLRSGHRGLTKLAREHSLNPERLVPGRFIVFVNNRLDKVKVYAAAQTLLYVHLNKGRKFSTEVLARIPSVFDPNMQWTFSERLNKLVEKYAGEEDQLAFSSGEGRL